MGKTKERHGNSTKKGLSWIYRKKVKLRRAKNVTHDKESNAKLQNSMTRIVVRNLSFKVNEEDVRKIYEKYGEIQEIVLPRQKNGTLFGYAFIEFKRMQDASKAIFNTNKKEFFGRTITSAWAIENSKLCEKVKNISETDNKNKNPVSSSNKSNLDIKTQDKSSSLQETDIPKRKKKKR
ncbi:hypothetical protein KPH14_012555 [Odynerus spinipes]|uniref:RRM domain-containing protein n=1 Tax=Odynerus spinipes TaxID=1348599 RepID=A0AAD9RIM1_9HYME|nr:hypothetical protein KPH14_012555 [Odynerus spinipes]